MVRENIRTLAMQKLMLTEIHNLLLRRSGHNDARGFIRTKNSGNSEIQNIEFLDAPRKNRI